MALSNANKLAAVGLPTETARVLVDVITDIVAGGGSPAASAVSFDPSDAPGITATNVQGAIEELATIVDGA